jgi:hypothetical protein
MADPASVNIQAFTPNGGGQGARLAATSVSSRALIPGLAGGQQGAKSRLVVSNSGFVSAYVTIGGSDVVATTASLEILPGTKELLSPPFVGTKAMYLAAVTASGSTTVNVCAGEGT